MYEVVNRFRDRDGTIYEVGDMFNASLTDFRHKTLTTEENNYGQVFLKELEGERYPKATGGGWYELSNGERVQGKKEAKEQEKLLKK